MKRAGKWAEILVGLAFIWAGFLKLLDPSAFLSAILTYEVLSHELSAIAALWVPYLELCAGACLVFRVLKGGARIVAIGLLMVFLVLLVQAALRGLNVDCGCFGSSSTSAESGFAWPIARDLLMLAGLFWGIRADSGSRTELRK